MFSFFVWDYYDEKTAFVERLQRDVDVHCFENKAHVTPKKREEQQGGEIVRHYENGVIERVTSSSPHSWRQNSQNWEGSRQYPNGVEERGTFEDFRFLAGCRLCEVDSKKRADRKFGAVHPSNTLSADPSNGR